MSHVNDVDYGVEGVPGARPSVLVVATSFWMKTAFLMTLILKEDIETVRIGWIVQLSGTPLDKVQAGCLQIFMIVILYLKLHP